MTPGSSNWAAGTPESELFELSVTPVAPQQQQRRSSTVGSEPGLPDPVDWVADVERERAAEQQQQQQQQQGEYGMPGGAIPVDCAELAVRAAEAGLAAQRPRIAAGAGELATFCWCVGQAGRSFADACGVLAPRV